MGHFIPSTGGLPSLLAFLQDGFGKGLSLNSSSVPVVVLLCFQGTPWPVLPRYSPFPSGLVLRALIGGFLFLF